MFLTNQSSSRGSGVPGAPSGPSIPTLPDRIYGRDGSRPKYHSTRSYHRSRPHNHGQGFAGPADPGNPAAPTSFAPAVASQTGDASLYRAAAQGSGGPQMSQTDAAPQNRPITLSQSQSQYYPPNMNPDQSISQVSHTNHDSPGPEPCAISHPVRDVFGYFDMRLPVKLVPLHNRYYADALNGDAPKAVARRALYQPTTVSTSTPGSVYGQVFRPSMQPTLFMAPPISARFLQPMATATWLELNNLSAGATNTTAGSYGSARLHITGPLLERRRYRASMTPGLQHLSYPVSFKELPRDTNHASLDHRVYPAMAVPHSQLSGYPAPPQGLRAPLMQERDSTKEFNTEYGGFMESRPAGAGTARAGFEPNQSNANVLMTPNSEGGPLLPRFISGESRFLKLMPQKEPVAPSRNGPSPNEIHTWYDLVAQYKQNIAAATSTLLE